MPSDPAHLLAEGETLHWWAAGARGQICAITSARAFATTPDRSGIAAELQLVEIASAATLVDDDGTETLRFEAMTPGRQLFGDDAPLAMVLGAAPHTPFRVLPMLDFAGIPDAREAYRALDTIYAARLGRPLML